MSSLRPSLGAALLAVVCITGAANATTIGFGNIPSARTLFEEGGTTQLAPGSLVWTGTFANESFSLGAGTIAANVSAIQTAGGWSQFTGTNATPLGIYNNTGSSKVGGAVTENGVSANAFNGDNVYLWVFNAPTVGASTQMGIFRATTATTPWLFPTNAGGVGDTTTLSTTSAGASVMAAIGGVGSTTSSAMILESPTPIPEPSTFVFGIIGAAAAACSRQRRRTF